MVEEKKHTLKDLLLSETEQRYPLTTTCSSKDQIYIPGLQAKDVHFLTNPNPNEMIKIFNEFINYRSIRDTEVNEVSSRSHVIFIIIICLKNL